MITITYRVARQIFTETMSCSQAKAWLQGIYGLYPPREITHIDYSQSGLKNVAAVRDWLDRMDGLAEEEEYEYDADPHY